MTIHISLSRLHSTITFSDRIQPHTSALSDHIQLPEHSISNCTAPCQDFCYNSSLISSLVHESSILCQIHRLNWQYHIGSHHTRASTRAALTKTKTEEELKKQADPIVKDPITAINFLMEGDFKSKDDKKSFKLLGVIAMQLSQQPRNPKMASEAFKAISYLIFNIHQKTL